MFYPSVMLTVMFACVNVGRSEFGYYPREECCDERRSWNDESVIVPWRHPRSCMHVAMAFSKVFPEKCRSLLWRFGFYTPDSY